MAKLRVYELAKELEMTNNDLVARLLDMGIQVKGHMSSLDENQAQVVRDMVAGRSQQMIVEKRVGRDIIRRRRKIVAAEPTVEPEPEEVEIPEKPLVEAAPPPPPPPSPASEPGAEKSLEAVPVAAAPAPEPLAPPPPEELRAPSESVVAAPPSAQPEVTPPEAVVKPLEAEEPKKEEAKKPRRRMRKDAPAKIIKLPERVLEVTPEVIPAKPAEVVKPVAAGPKLAEIVPIAEEGEAGLRAKKKRGKRREEEEADRRRLLPSRRKEVFTGDDLYGERATVRGRKGATRPVVKELRKPEITVPKAIKRRIRLDDAITLASLAKRMGVKATDVIKKLMGLGVMAVLNQAIDFETASLVASEFNYEVEKVSFIEEDIMQAEPDRAEDLRPRPPVVTIMGHVDHGKTLLLDAIRHTNVTEGEAGGITQHIGAYLVSLDGGDVVFLDTPGHEAFTAMRARGARVTDLVILVVAADDGVMQQTIEAINHAQAAEIPILVAVNKIDKPNANPDRVKRQLAELGLTPEEWGGHTTMVEVSAKKGTGIEELLELILLQAELLELKANPSKMARGRVIEAKLDRGKGPVATVLVQEGTLRAGDPFVCGTFAGRVRALLDDRGRKVEEATPSLPVEVHGISGVPQAGDEFVVVGDDKQAKQVASHRQLKQREAELFRATKVTLDNLFSRIREGETKELKVVLKADVQGSLEAILESLQKLGTDEIKVRIIHSAVGAVTETDVMLASASDAIIIGFGVRAETKVQELADREKVDVRYYDIIYQIISDVQAAMEGMLEPTYKETFMGRAEVVQTFNIPKVGTIAGCMVKEGRVERGAKVRVLRDNVVINDSKVASLRRYKDDAKEVRAGQDCGIGVENFNDIKVGDVLETYGVEEIKPVLRPAEGKTE
ncbi:MAG: bacterial translation initiation factor 2 (bIF-2) [Deltaproteobacteria bacterium]|nr:bacterial translation initiation factor 2 (bIF-2) [Deltaproteobacteria bacterium]